MVTFGSVLCTIMHVMLYLLKPFAIDDNDGWFSNWNDHSRYWADSPASREKYPSHQSLKYIIAEKLSGVNCKVKDDLGLCCWCCKCFLMQVPISSLSRFQRRGKRCSMEDIQSDEQVRCHFVSASKKLPKFFRLSILFIRVKRSRESKESYYYKASIFCEYISCFGEG